MKANYRIQNENGTFLNAGTGLESWFASYSRTIELLNEKASNYARQQVIKGKIEVLKELHSENIPNTEFSFSCVRKANKLLAELKQLETPKDMTPQEKLDELVVKELCSACKTNGATKKHTCPYAEEINNDSESLCNCCECCTCECGMAI